MWLENLSDFGIKRPITTPSPIGTGVLDENLN